MGQLPIKQDVPDRDTWERRVARDVARALRITEGEVFDLLGDPPELANLGRDFWAMVEAEMRQAVTPNLELIYMESAERLMSSTPIGVDWALVNAGAVEWAAQYAGDFVRGTTETTRRAINNKIAQFFETPGLTQGDLRRSLAPTFGPVRADMIAQTEVTRASAQGEIAIADALRQEGIEMVAIWRTSNDELVCPICGPRNGKQQGDGWQDPPPAHVRCRCFLSHEFVRD